MFLRIAPNLLIVLASCGRLRFDSGVVDDANADSALEPDAYVCNPTLPFGTPVPISELNTVGRGDGTFRTTPDELHGYFWSYRDSSTTSRIFYTSRPDLATPWTVEPTVGFDDGRNSVDPAIASDGTIMVLRKNSPDDLYYAPALDRRTFETPVAIATINTLSTETQPFLQPEGNELIFNSSRTGGGDLYRSIRTGTTFSTPSLITELATPDDEGDPVLSSDGLTLYFRRNVDGAADYDIFVATRMSPALPFGAAALVENVNTVGAAEGPSALSPDGCRLYMTSDRVAAGDYDIYVATRGL